MAMKKAVCFGEILWDMLPSGKKPGGAPMNVAAHLHRFGVPVTTISRIGLDGLAEEMLDFLYGIGLSTEAVQQDEVYPTGRVNVDLSNPSEAKYDIEFPAAWDFIELDETVLSLAKEADLFVFGSLGARSKQSRNTLLELIKKSKFSVFDVNFRPPHYSKEIIEELGANVSAMKLNREELHTLTSWYSSRGETLEDNMRLVQEQFALELLIVTRDADGAAVLSGGQIYEHPGFKVEVEDTIGSGDSFLASFLKCLLDGKPIAEALEFACAVGAFVATQKGANPKYSNEDILAVMSQSNVTI